MADIKAAKANRFPVTRDDAGLQVDGRGICPCPSAISGAESGSMSRWRVAAKGVIGPSRLSRQARGLSAQS